MIIYDLKCIQGHAYEGWFDNADAFQEQQEKGLITCPVCGTSDVDRKPSTFGISRQRHREAPEAPSPNHITQLIEYIKNNFEDVGPTFAREALKMHYGVTEHRNIRGVSSTQEEELLRQEGVKFFKIPAEPPPSSDED
ncbi:MAG: DUF1178 family protein [Deltaproteobacteria bacterium]|nr:DUF1178 family protein [Deltaproteobacteria bacterium]